MLNVGGEIGNVNFWAAFGDIVAYLTFGFWLLLIFGSIVLTVRNRLPRRYAVLFSCTAVVIGPIVLFGLSTYLDRNLVGPV